MKNSYTEIHYGEELRPKNKYDYMVCKHLADNYFKAKKGNLLDVCCGKGKHIKIFQEMGFDAWGIDMELTTDNQMIVKCNVDKEKFPFEDNTFDFILVKSAIEHVRNIYPFMEEVYRVLKKGGKVVILTCDWKAVHKIFYDDAGRGGDRLNKNIEFIMLVSCLFMTGLFFFIFGFMFPRGG